MNISLSILFVIILGVPYQILAQVQKALDDPNALSWLEQRLDEAVAQGKQDPRLEETLRMFLNMGRSPIAQRVNIGAREIAVERYFLTAQLLTGRFPKDPGKRFQWHFMMTDLVVRGRVLEVSEEKEICVYGTTVVIEVSKYLKGTGPETVNVKLIQGRKLPDGRKILVVFHAPSFEVGEDVLVRLSATPMSGHSQVSGLSTPDCKDFFYVTNTKGAYYEVGVGEDSKRTIVDGKLEWQGEVRTIEEVEALILSDLKATF